MSALWKHSYRNTDDSRRSLICSFGRNWITPVMILMHVYIKTNTVFGSDAADFFLIWTDHHWTSVSFFFTFLGDSAVQYIHLVYRDLFFLSILFLGLNTLAAGASLDGRWWWWMFLKQWSLGRFTCIQSADFELLKELINIFMFPSESEEKVITWVFSLHPGQIHNFTHSAICNKVYYKS